MKKCPFCGLENPVDAILCSTCQTELDPQPSASAAPGELRRYEMSPGEQRFWEKMTFRQFAFVIVRLQSLWFFFNAITNLTYLPRYFPLSYPGMHFELSTAIKTELVTLIIRILLEVGVGVFLITNTEYLLSWLVKDLVSTTTPQKND